MASFTDVTIIVWFIYLTGIPYNDSILTKQTLSSCKLQLLMLVTHRAGRDVSCPVVRPPFVFACGCSRCPFHLAAAEVSVIPFVTRSHAPFSTVQSDVRNRGGEK